jgi:TetR/AcrR family transcriptional regulator, copper-responsive repressor
MSRAKVAKKPGRPRSFDRARALDRALRLFWARGYEGTSVADLTGALGIVPPSLYAAFGSKEQLFHETVALYGQRYGLDLPGALAARTARAAVTQLLHEAAQRFARRATPRGCFVMSGMLSRAPEQAGVADFVATRRALLIKTIADRMAWDVASGKLDRRTDVQALARFYGAVIAGLSVQARDGTDARTLSRIAAIAMQAWPAPRAAASRSRLR